ncbi:sensor domain-containing diguanylate cyclase [Larsenimonas suaedae]|uniref:diguanylate cyclase n=1 Tax=Larsenimonas suaedae TaxID=1851019 RepID=A0ABU1GXH7_9GAMM|nr:diguanylate cyclase [Larsenimonas suaedae]MCM2971494.1 diguanylate cyclase [Larsenimonas suaedae]MDR5896750.1 diguanylate cyclase [Larsenimonas suaedae]
MVLSLRKRFLLRLSLLGVTSIVLLYVASFALVQPRMIAGETRSAHANLDRITHLLDSRMSHLNVITRDWAQWDMSVEFVGGRMPTYPAVNFSEAMLKDAQQTLMVFFDQRQQVRWVVGIDPSTGQYTSCEGGKGACAWSLELVRLIDRHLSSQPPRSESWLLSSPMPAIVATSPILTTDARGPTRGWLGIVQLLDESWQEQAKTQTGLQLSIRAVPKAYPGRMTVTPHSTTIKRDASDKMTVTRLIKASPESAYLAITAILPRTDYQGGIRALFGVTATLAIIFILTLISVAVLLERLIIKPMHTLGTYTQTLRHQEDRFYPLPESLLSRDDEIGLLARDVQRLINEERTRNVTLLHQTRTDELTGLANRRQFEECLQKALEQARTAETPLCVLMIDIDFFKGYNDHFGHPEGDQCLRMVGDLMQSCFAGGDELAARTGGEEFMVLLPNTALEPARQRAEGLMRELGERRIPHPGSRVSKYLTLSIGLSILKPGTERSPKDLIKAADIALYAAKTNGRNRVVTEHGFRPSLNDQ